MRNESVEQLRDIVNSLIFNDINNDLINDRSSRLNSLLVEAIMDSYFVKKVLDTELKGEFLSFINKIQMHERLYDSMRIVDPIKREVLELKKVSSVINEFDSKCYDFWEKNKICENCISTRAFIENDVIIKMEAKNNDVYMITALPITIKGKKFVVELLKDLTGIYNLENENFNYKKRILTSIEHMNQDFLKDKLTLLYNKKFLYERLPIDIMNSSIKNRPISIILADLDNFKYVNERYGFKAGDYVLLSIAEIFKEKAEAEKGWVARFEGDKFLLCFPNKNNNSTISIAESLKSVLSNKKFLLENTLINLTCSFGVYTIEKLDDYTSLEDIIETVDRYLLQAKLQGRDIVAYNS